ncbi:unnamed protein product, partial [Musa textilis]
VHPDPDLTVLTQRPRRKGIEGPTTSRSARGVIPEQADYPLLPTRRRLLIRTPTEVTQAHPDPD